MLIAEANLFAVALPAAPSWLADVNSGKMLLFFGALVGLILLGRWISSRSDVSVHDPALMSHTSTPAVHAVEPPDKPHPDSPVHSETDFGPVILRKFYFGNFDALSGPADPASFVDEVTIEVVFKDTGVVVENTFTVATPLGLSQLMAAKEWGILYSPDVFVVTRYDLQTLREAIMERFLERSEADATRAKSNSNPLAL